MIDGSDGTDALERDERTIVEAFGARATKMQKDRPACAIAGSPGSCRRIRLQGSTLAILGTAQLGAHSYFVECAFSDGATTPPSACNDLFALQ